MKGAGPLTVRRLGLQPYTPVWQAMTEFTASRDKSTGDEIWLVEHQPVFTQGQAGKAEHVLAAGDIPVVQADRGGQVTYHGPGQQIVYLMLDVRRLNAGVRQLVTAMENAIIGTLSEWGIEAYARSDAPGVYVATDTSPAGEAKIASLGLRIRRGCSFHGLALNVDMDLGPFQRINPCGYAGMAVTQASALNPSATLADAGERLVQHLAQLTGYNEMIFTDQLPDFLESQEGRDGREKSSGEPTVI